MILNSLLFRAKAIVNNVCENFERYLQKYFEFETFFRTNEIFVKKYYFGPQLSELLKSFYGYFCAEFCMIFFMEFLYENLTMRFDQN